MTEERCEVTELLVEQCGCAQHRGGEAAEEIKATDGLLIERFMLARFAGVCRLLPNDASHRITPGDYIGMAVEDNESGRPPFKIIGWVCEECTHSIAHD